MRGRRGLYAGALILVAVLVWLARRDNAPIALPTPPSPEPVAAAQPQPLDPAAPADPRGPPADQVAPLVPEGAPAITLPEDTQLLAEEFVPGTTEWEEVPLVEGSSQVIRFVPARYNVIAPEPIVLYLEVVDTATGKRVDVGRPVARVKPFDRDGWIEIPMVDDGSGRDEAAHDHRYTATYVPTATQQAQLLGRVAAEAELTTRAAGTRRIPQALIYTRGPRAHLTGHWRDELDHGHLVLSAELEVEAAGLFTLMAQLTGPGREPIALVRTSQRLDAGTHWLRLRVFGKALHDAGIDGPYTVRNVLLTRDMNERGDYDPGPTILVAHTTAAYHFTDFDPAPYIDTAAPPAPTAPSPTDPPPLYTDRPSGHAR